MVMGDTTLTWGLVVAGVMILVWVVWGRDD